MHVTELRAVLGRTLAAMPAHSEELRALDAAIGDGDLGITVAAGSTAANEALSVLSDDADVRTVLQTIAKAFSTANPSTFAALVGGGLIAAAKGAGDTMELDRDNAVALGEAVAARIAERGKARLGDKTLLDALIPSLETLRLHFGDGGASDSGILAALDAMIVTSQSQIDSTAGLQSAKGRAAWVQERSVGHPDPGATAYLRFLQELRSNWTSE